MRKCRSNVSLVDCLSLTKIELSFMNRNLEEAIRKAKYCYEQRKGKLDYRKVWKDKKNENFDQRKKGFKPYNFRNQQNQLAQVQK